MSKLAVAFTVGLAILVPGLAHPATPAATAQTDGTAVETARAHFRRGVQLFNEGSLEAALAEFRKVYQIAPNYRVLFNIAQTYFELHDYVSAHKTLKQYVQDGGNEITPARRIQVDELNQKLEERIAYLEIVANLDGADIRVDDISVGLSPLKGPVLVNAGPRRVAAVKPGYDAALRVVTVTGAERAKVILEVAELVPPAGEGARGGTSALASPSPLTIVKKPSVAYRPPRTGLIASIAVAGGCLVATGIFGYMALQAKKDFETELDRVPNTHSAIDDARARASLYAYVTDAFAAVTLVAAGTAVYFALTDDGRPAISEQSPSKRSVGVVPTLGGLAFHGRW